MGKGRGEGEERKNAEENQKKGGMTGWRQQARKGLAQAQDMVHKAGTLWAEGNARSLVEAAPLACQRRR
ncbi:hypothetical protein DPV78_004043 [Talaromyces pinophilus]|nr:hypothetical protein DPV78_004043 [Talaromyces pinophilus]